ncbi:Adrenoleukodystrophy protein [Mycena indigotica]|uniref:Adrenoleukodystrophy protein n=1 Tax=Mycena indigotica TaxID=2126181 RepID=A0A8H6WBP8_9AGAR|nr:Adrenoleukodystrophy protein [Mycena indigotica]KAF7306564.1 Adrenoleukodystrophy protein [Mycena indigotica]
MSSIPQDILQANEKYALNFDIPTGPRKKPELVLVTCMDPRIQPYEQFGLTFGECAIVRNAGGSAHNALPEIIIAQHVGLRHIAIVHHTDCGMSHLTAQALKDGVKEANGAEAAQLLETIDFHEWTDVVESVQRDVNYLHRHPVLRKSTRITACWLTNGYPGPARDSAVLMQVMHVIVFLFPPFSSHVMSTTARKQQLNELLKRFAKNYAAHRPTIQRLLNLGFALYVVGSTARRLTSGQVSSKQSNKSKGKGKDKDEGKSSRAPKVAVDAHFYAQLAQVLKIVIHRKEAMLLVFHSSLLVFRTVLSLYVASLDGTIVASLVRAEHKQFFLNILRWLIVAIPATWCNSWLNYIQSKLAIAYRTRLTTEVLGQYLGSTAEGPEEKVYYKLSNLDDRIVNADQMITNDIQKFSIHLAALYSNLAKPVLDVILYNYQLSQNVGAEGLIVLTVLVQATAALLRLLTPPFGAYTAMSAQLAGSLRHAHSRLAEFSEEIAFMRGEEHEKMLIEREYASVIKHENHVLNRRWLFGCIEEGIIKWLWGSFGLILCATPVFIKIPGISKADLGGRTEGFITNRRLLMSSSDAFGRIMYSYKEIAELAGYTSRVSLLLDTMKDIRHGKFKKALVNSATTGENAEILKGRGVIIESPDIQFENVPIVTPTGDVLVKSLSFHISEPGQHLLVIGPNGCGKSSLFRILGGLWPVYGGVVRKPAASEFILIPQRPYLSLGTLRDQIIYPHSKATMDSRGITDSDLFTILSVVQMESIVDREGGWDAAKEWRDTLSGGDKQKIAWARLFYHHPKYAILDEATSLVPQDMEGKLMQHATKLGITLLTVSHRPSLWKWHSLILQYDGVGGYVFTKLDAEKRLALQEEKQALEAKLLEIPKMEARLAELKALTEEAKNYEHSWSHVVNGMWHKYPNPKCTHVVSIDVVDRTVDPQTGIIRTERILGCKQKAPGWIVKLFGGSEDAFVREISFVDPARQRADITSINLSLSQFATCLETIQYTPAPGNRTTFTQTAEIQARMTLWRTAADGLERWLVQRFEQNAQLGKLGFTDVLRALEQRQTATSIA